MDATSSISELVIQGKISLSQDLTEKILNCRNEEEIQTIWNKIPFMDKGTIRSRFPDGFGFSRSALNDLIKQGKIEIERTSGTTEESTELILPTGWWDKQETHALSLNERIKCTFSPDTNWYLSPDKRVTIVSPSCSNDICYTGVPSQEERTLNKTLFVNISKHPFLWTDSIKEQMLQETLSFEPVFLDVDPVYGTLFADYCRKKSCRIPSLKFILSSYEYLSRAHRRYLGEIFGVPVYNLYGSTETGHLLMEDSQGILRIAKENALLEFLPLPSDETLKECVVTTLTNPYMPLLRYRIGDLFCERDERLRLMGRLKDALITHSGDPIPVSWIDDAITISDKILHYQLVQLQDINTCRLDYFLREDANDLTLTEKNLIASNLITFMGWNTKIIFRSVDYIPCEPSGKFRLVIPQKTNKLFN